MNGSTFLAGLAILTATLVSGAQTPAGKPTAKPVDAGLENAIKSIPPITFSASNHIQNQRDRTAHTFELIITSAKDPEHDSRGESFDPERCGSSARMPTSMTSRKRAASTGSCGTTEGKAEFKTPVVYHHDRPRPWTVRSAATRWSLIFGVNSTPKGVTAISRG
jgi:hypothetical protein